MESVPKTNSPPLSNLLAFKHFTIFIQVRPFSKSCQQGTTY